MSIMLIVAFLVLAGILFGVYKSTLTNTVKAVIAVVAVLVFGYVAFGGHLGMTDPMAIEKIDQQGGR